MADTFLEKLTRCAKVCGLFLFVCLWACLSDADWLGRQTLITWRELLITLEHFLERQPKFINILYCIPELGYVCLGLFGNSGIELFVPQDSQFNAHNLYD